MAFTIYPKTVFLDQPRRCRPPQLYLITALILSLFCSSTLISQGLSLNNCHKVPFSEPVGWLTSGSWSENDRESLLLVDASTSEVLNMSTRGQIKGSYTEQIVNAAVIDPLTAPKPVRPSQIRAVPNGYLLEDEETDEILRLDGSPDVSIPIKGRKIGDSQEAELKVVYDWAPMAEGIFAFGDLLYDRDQGEGRWKSAFVYFEEDAYGHSQIFHQINIEDSVRNHYVRVSLPYIATQGDVGYFLHVDKKEAVIKIGEVRPGVEGFELLDIVPREFRKRFQLNKFSEWTEALLGREKVTLFLEILEQTSTVAGIYAWDNSLFLLAKNSASDEGSTPWWLIQINPDSEELESRVRLPTNASHLSLLPGDEFSAIIEKGPISSIGEEYAPYMDISSMVLVPTSWLEGPTENGLSASKQTVCATFHP